MGFPTCSMGGRGSGYHSWRRVPRNLVEHAFVLDVSALGEFGALTGTVGYGHLMLVARASGAELLVSYTTNLADSANPHLELTFSVDGASHEQVICLSVSEPRYGGIRAIVQRRAARAGLEAKAYSGHSLRAGFATTAAAVGIEERVIMRQTRHRSSTVVRRYIRDGELFRRNFAAEIGL